MKHMDSFDRHNGVAVSSFTKRFVPPDGISIIPKKDQNADAKSFFGSSHFELLAPTPLSKPSQRPKSTQNVNRPKSKSKERKEKEVFKKVKHLRIGSEIENQVLKTESDKHFTFRWLSRTDFLQSNNFQTLNKSDFEQKYD
jgi:hypothetical protein